jgi:RimJ/RimL family protein N-acetyltransferase
VVLETPRLRLRELRAEDAAQLAELFADRVVMAHYWNFLPPEASVNWAATHARLYETHGYAPWTVELRDGTFVGQCGPLPQSLDGRDEVEIVCFLLRPFWREGYADEACRAAMDFAFELIGVDRVVAMIFPANRPSIRLALRCGFAYERDVIRDGLVMKLYTAGRASLEEAPRARVGP